jgi:hypothetical protein
VVPVAALSSDISERLGAQTTIVGISRETVDKQLLNHPEILAEDYSELADVLVSGKVVTQAETHLAFVGRSDLPWIAIIKRTRDGNELFLQSFYRAGSDRYVERLLRRGDVWRE